MMIETFRDLLPGQTFVFIEADGTDGMRWGSSGPWRKMGAGKYARESEYWAWRDSARLYTTSPNAKVRATKQEVSR